jgi:isopropylmalate/homocitrate/citramalate synthase
MSRKKNKMTICVSPYNFEKDVIQPREIPDEVMVYDTTLRDGEQMPGISFNRSQKLAIAKKLDELGVHQIEAGFPIVSKEEREIVKLVAKEGLNADVLALTRLKREEIDLAAECEVDMALVFIASSDIHIKYKLKHSCEELLDCVFDVLDHAKSYDMKINFSTEDSTRTELKRLFEFYSTAARAGVDRIGITDTVGCISPQALGYLVTKVKECYELPLAIHLHNDFGLALANALAGVEAGANAVAVTVGGIGERAGNVSLEQFAISMKVLYNYDMGLETGRIKELAEMVHKFAGVKIAPHQPLIGENVFSHESGMHIAAILRQPVTYECIPPSIVGQSRRLLMGKHTGGTFIKKRLAEKKLKASPQELDTILKEIKVLGEFKGKVTEDEFWKIVEMVLGSQKGS